MVWQATHISFGLEQEGWTTLDKFERESSVLQRLQLVKCCGILRVPLWARLRHPAVPSYYGSVVRDRPNGQDFGSLADSHEKAVRFPIGRQRAKPAFGGCGRRKL